MLDSLISVLMPLSFLSAAAFIVHYQVRSRGDWRLTRSGRNIMGMAFALFLVTLSVALTRIFTTYPGQEVLQAFAYGTVVLIVAQRGLLLERVSREDLAPDSEDV